MPGTKGRFFKSNTQVYEQGLWAGRCAPLAHLLPGMPLESELVAGRPRDNSVFLSPSFLSSLALAESVFLEISFRDLGIPSVCATPGGTLQPSATSSWRKTPAKLGQLGRRCTLLGVAKVGGL